MNETLSFAPSLVEGAPAWGVAVGIAHSQLSERMSES
jgi:hypothetical protein